MKIISFNCNGIRSALSKGFGEWILKENPDLFCLQETKANPSQIPDNPWKEAGYIGYHHTAQKPGYSSVAVYSKIQPLKVHQGIGDSFFDSEGRSLGIELSDFYLWNLYFPSGTSGEARQAKKMEFLERIYNLAQEYLQKYPKIILCGDLNIAHTEQDIHDPKGNEKNSGFLPEERDWLSRFLKIGWIDTFRYRNPSRVQYTWWTYRFQAREKNKGWRIDYFLATENLKPRIRESGICTNFQGSDHAPIYLIID